MIVLLFSFCFFSAAERMVRNANMQNVTIYKLNNLSYVGKQNVEAEQLETKHKERLGELEEKHKERLQELEK
jgi:hypothetical protein